MFRQAHAAGSRGISPRKTSPTLIGLVLAAAFALVLALTPRVGQAATDDDASLAAADSSSSVNYLCFTAQEANCSIALNWITSDESEPAFGQAWKISTDKATWTDYTIGSTISLAKTGDKVYWRANDGGVLTLGQFKDKYFQFSISGKVAASGSIMTLLDPTDTARTLKLSGSCKKFTFTKLFYGCTTLTSAPELPATEICMSCYEYMFAGCTSLTSAPSLPATTMAYRCYKSMFSGCTSLASAPDLPATTLDELCYANMFEGCTSLTTMPLMGGGSDVALNEDGCCQSMFSGCSNLVAYASAGTGLECKLNCSSVTGDAATHNMFAGCSTTGSYNSKNAAPATGSFACYGTASAKPTAYTLGDVNNNSAINIADAQIVLDMANGVWTTPGTSAQEAYDLLISALASSGTQWDLATLRAAADVNADSAIDGSDARAIQVHMHTGAWS